MYPSTEYNPLNQNDDEESKSVDSESNDNQNKVGASKDNQASYSEAEGSSDEDIENQPEAGLAALNPSLIKDNVLTELASLTSDTEQTLKTYLQKNPTLLDLDAKIDAFSKDITAAKEIKKPTAEQEKAIETKKKLYNWLIQFKAGLIVTQLNQTTGAQTTLSLYLKEHPDILNAVIAKLAEETTTHLPSIKANLCNRMWAIQVKFEVLNLSEKVMSDDDQRYWRNVFFAFASISLLAEVAYGVFQQEITTQGLIGLGCEPTAARALGVLFGGALDFIGNIFTISPANNATDFANSSVTKLKRLGWLSTIIFVTSCTLSYPVGAAGGFVGILPYITSDTTPDWQFYLLSATVGTPMILSGMAYYIGFNGLAGAKSLRAFEDFIDSPKVKRDLFESHTLEVTARAAQTTLEVGSLATYRSMGFAAISGMTLDAMGLKGPQAETIKLAVAAAAFSGTLVNVLGTRAIKTVQTWMNTEFAHIRATEKTEPELIDYAHLNMLIAAIMTIGLAAIVKAYANNDSTQEQWVNPAIVGTLLLLLVTLAHRSLVMNKKALKVMGPTELETRINSAKDAQKALEATASAMTQPVSESTSAALCLTNNSDCDIEAQQEPLLSKEEAEAAAAAKKEQRTERLTAAEEAFAALSKSFENHLLSRRSAIVSAGGRVARILGFLDFTNFIATIAHQEIPIMATLGLAGVVGPANIRNEYKMFDDGIKETVLQKTTEAYIAYCIATKNDTPTTRLNFSQWSKCNIPLQYQLYTKSRVEYTFEEIAAALARRSAELSDVPAELSDALDARTYFSKNPMQGSSEASKSISLMSSNGTTHEWAMTLTGTRYQHPVTEEKYSLQELKNFGYTEVQKEVNTPANY